MFGRFTNPAAANPLSGNEAAVAIANRILTNTVEQLVLFLPNLALFSILISKERLCLVPFVVAVFTVGRLVYLIGYTIHPQHRVFGFSWTFSSSMSIFWYNLIKMICSALFSSADYI